MSQVMSMAEAAGLIPEGSTVSVSSSSGLHCPDAILRAIGERFAATGSPKSITSINPIAAGDMYGNDGIDHLARPGLLKRVVAGSYPSGPSSMPSPKIWPMIIDDEVEAYNLPSGIPYHLHQDAAAKRPGVLTKVGLDTFVDPRRHGGRMNARTTEELVDVVVVDPDQMQKTETRHDPAISGEIRVLESGFEAVPWGTDEVIARRAAMALRAGEAVNLGFEISALVPRVLLEEGHGDDVTWVIEQGAVGGVPLLGFAFGRAANAAAFMPSPAQFLYFRGGGFDQTCLSFMQVGADGSVNVSKLASRPHVTAGAGGFVDISAHARRFVFAGYLTAGGPSSTSPTGSRRWSPRGRARSSCRASSTSPTAARRRSSAAPR